MGTLEGKLRTGWVILCKDCNDKRKIAEWMRDSDKKVDMPDFMKDIFGNLGKEE
jgi:hypothetical protein